MHGTVNDASNRGKNGNNAEFTVKMLKYTLYYYNDKLPRRQ